MNKNLKGALIALAVVVLFIAAFFGTRTNKYESISYEEYTKIKNDSVVYIGEKSDAMDNIKDVKSGVDVLYLNYSKLTKEEKKSVENNTIEVIKDSKVEGKYKFDKFNLEKNDKKSSIKEVKTNEYLDLIKKDGLHFMFVGKETCGYCTMYKEEINKLYNDYKIDIYYIDIEAAGEEGYSSIVASDDYFSSNEWGTPTSLIYYNGQRIGLISGYVEKESLANTLNNEIGIKTFLIDNKVM